MKPTWESDCGTVRLYRGDCIDVLPALASGRVAVVTDPPYGIRYSHGAKSGVLAKTSRFVGQRIAGDDRPFDPSPWLAFPSVILWGANHYADRLPPRARWLVWDKRDGVRSNDLADCELAWMSDTRPARLFSHRWMGMLKASERGIPRVHPTQKPIALMAWCLSFVPLGFTILDPYMGAGSTALACLQTGRRFIGVELDAAHYRTALRRIKAALRERAAAAA